MVFNVIETGKMLGIELRCKVFDKIYLSITIEYLSRRGYLDGIDRGESEMTMTDHRKPAEECVEIEQTARTSAQRTMLLHIAETWMNLARDAEGNSSRGAAEKNSQGTSSLN